MILVILILIDENKKTIMINIILKLIFENLFNLVIYDYINFLQINKESNYN